MVNRMPWELKGLSHPFEDDVWELYHVAEDFSESTDLAEKYPEKLKELQQVFDDEAWANNVYPLYDDMIKRLAGVRRRFYLVIRKNLSILHRALFELPKKPPPRSRTGHMKL